MLPLVAVSGAECERVLRAAGFVRRARSAGMVVLSKGLRTVRMPDTSLLSAQELGAVLRQAGLPYGDFLDYLDQLGESEAKAG